ncbi:Pyruvate kinase isozyme G, chloroplastic [Sesamum alatum]|uniref:pyruvate kinase n=1 Tax=Sesamum alatum TaxID=300844 RepID=A0AAE1Y399_9LAMI|nr:Pyruvate kinase isozyme G, chloroplastic [Sesamum alatum]
MAATINLPSGMPAFNSQAGCLSSAKKITELFFQCKLRRTSQRVDLCRSTKISNSSSYGNRESNAIAAAFSPNGVAIPSTDDGPRPTRMNVNAQRKTKIVCTIGPSTSSRDMIWKLAEAGMNVARLNMSHGDHASHQKTIDLVKEYNAQFQEKVVAVMLDTKGPEVRSGDVPQPILLKEGQEFNFTIKRGVSTADTVSVNYDDFINDVEVR